MSRATESFSDVETVARTVWGEARGEGPAGWAAVAWVIRNRAAHPGWWGRDLRGVCLCPRQFSCWNVGDANRAQIIALPDDDPTLSAIRATVDGVLTDTIPDPTGGATHYHTRAVAPVWATHLVATATIGGHEFYKEV